MVSGLITTWQNTYGCADHYICATALYLFIVLLKSFNINIENGISAPGHDREVVDVLNATQKSFIFHLMYTIQISGSERFDTKMKVHTAT